VEPSAKSSRPARRIRLAVGAALAAAAVLPYLGVAGHGFLYFDDPEYVTGNPVVRQGLSWDGVRWAFGTFAVANWHPLAWLSHLLDVQLFGLDAGAHHAVNVALHALNAVLLFAALARLTGSTWRSALVAALFAVHPLHVESVAWISERKDLLSTTLGLAMLWAHARQAERPGPGREALVAAFLALSLLAKAMWVTAPFLLLLLDVWPLRRLERGGRPAALVLEKLPLLVLSAAAAVLAVVAQSRFGALESLERLGPGARLANAAVACASYLAKTLWPASLAAWYPLPAGGQPAAAVALAVVVLAAVTLLAAATVRTVPAIAVGWLWFLGTLVPVIGLVQVGSQAMADRYTYLPLVGVFLAMVWGGEALLRRAGPLARRAALAAVACALAALAAVTVRQAGFWVDQETLFRHALAVTPESGKAHLLLSQAIAERGDFPGALRHAREAARLDPWNPRAQKNLGYMLYRVGLVDDAIVALERAVALQPGWAEAHGNLAVAYGRAGRFDDAAREMARERALRGGGAR
jgi:tetratricopeptide (TPR) repeat protein